MERFSLRIKKANIIHPVIMFKLAKSYKPNMEDWQLYAVTRGQWKMRIEKAAQYKYAFACDGGSVKEVFEIESWHSCGDSMENLEKEYRKTNNLFAGDSGRIEFIGKIAPQEIRKLYVNTNVRDYWGKSQTPFKYVDP